MKVLKQEIQPDIDHIMGLFDKMKEAFQKEINERERMQLSLQIGGGPSNHSFS